MTAAFDVDAVCGYDPRTARRRDVVRLPDVKGKPERRTAMYVPGDEMDPDPNPWVVSSPEDAGADGGYWLRTVDIPDGAVLIARDGAPVMPLGMALDLLLDIAEQPIRARELAAALGRPIEEVRAELRKKQAAGTATSQARRWIAA